jgi:hypothetical protein
LLTLIIAGSGKSTVITAPLVERLSTGAAEDSTAVTSRVKVVLNILGKV